MNKNKNTETVVVGRVQLVKQGKLTARQAYDSLVEEAAKDGKTGLAVFKGSYAFKWLSRRLQNG